MERVKEGKWYWYISINCEGVSVNSKIDTYCVLDNKNFESNIYFHTKEEAEAMAERIRKVLKGADVIQMPTMSEFLDAMPEEDSLDVEATFERKGWKACFNWIKSKILK